MSNLVFNPLSKDFFKARACVAISWRYNYAGSCRTYRFPYLSFLTWSSSYRAAFCYVLKRIEDAAYKDESHILVHSDLCSLFFEDGHWSEFYDFSKRFLDSDPFYDFYFRDTFSPVEKLYFVYKFLDVLIRYNLGMVRYDLVSPMFFEKSAIRYATSKFFPDKPFVEIESDFMFKDVMD